MNGLVVAKRSVRSMIAATQYASLIVKAYPETPTALGGPFLLASVGKKEFVMLQFNSWTGTPGSGIVVLSPSSRVDEGQNPLLAAVARLSKYFGVTEDDVLGAFGNKEELLREGAIPVV